MRVDVDWREDAEQAELLTDSAMVEIFSLRFHRARFTRELRPVFCPSCKMHFTNRCSRENATVADSNALPFARDVKAMDRRRSTFDNRLASLTEIV
jgi:hypothetical protein